MFQNFLVSNCDHVVYLQCKPKAGSTHDICSGYLTAALKTGHTFMVTLKGGALIRETEVKWGFFNVAFAKVMLKGNSKAFVDDNGDMWFFCKCKSDKLTQCKNK